MTHEELLSELNELDHSCSVVGVTVAALRAVVELHKPCDCEEAHCDYCTSLHQIFSNEPYPCPTIQAIEAELQ